MRPTTRTIVLFLLVALTQLIAPANEIFQRELTLRTGVPVKFLTAPVDPVDAFRGQYVALAFQNMTLPVTSTVPYGDEYTDSKRMYATFETDADGVARLTGVSDERPASGLYVMAWVGPDFGAGSGQRVRVTLPFDRFYMEESLAPAAEEAYRQANQPGRQPAYVLVRLRDGQGVIEDLYIQGKPVRELLAPGA